MVAPALDPAPAWWPPKLRLLDPSRALKPEPKNQLHTPAGRQRQPVTPALQPAATQIGHPTSRPTPAPRATDPSTVYQQGDTRSGTLWKLSASDSGNLAPHTTVCGSPCRHLRPHSQPCQGDWPHNSGLKPALGSPGPCSLDPGTETSPPTSELALAQDTLDPKLSQWQDKPASDTLACQPAAPRNSHTHQQDKNRL